MGWRFSDVGLVRNRLAGQGAGRRDWRTESWDGASAGALANEA